MVRKVKFKVGRNDWRIILYWYDVEKGRNSL